MMGHVMNMLTDFLDEVGGPQATQAIFERAQIERKSYRFEVVYPEEEFGALVGAALEVLDLEVPDVEKAFAEYFMRVSPELFPAIFELSPDAKTLLQRVPILHKSIPSAASRKEYHEKLVVEETGEMQLRMHYDSPHRLCGFLKHLLQLTLDFYDEKAHISEHACAREGAPVCLIDVEFQRAG